jgi:hypothetical protein
MKIRKTDEPSLIDWCNDQVKGEVATVLFSVYELEPDVSNYKQISPKMLPLNLQVAIDLPKKYVLKNDEGSLTITSEGLYWIGLYLRATQEKVINESKQFILGKDELE